MVLKFTLNEDKTLAILVNIKSAGDLVTYSARISADEILTQITKDI